jgi:hypothetical protein
MRERKLEKHMIPHIPSSQAANVPVPMSASTVNKANTSASSSASNTQRCRLLSPKVKLFQKVTSVQSTVKDVADAKQTPKFKPNAAAHSKNEQRFRREPTGNDPCSY